MIEYSEMIQNDISGYVLYLFLAQSALSFEPVGLICNLMGREHTLAKLDGNNELEKLRVTGAPAELHYYIYRQQLMMKRRIMSRHVYLYIYTYKVVPPKRDVNVGS